MPDHTHVLQTFVWQHLDLAPRFPALTKFLEFWERNIDGKLHKVRVANAALIEPELARRRQPLEAFPLDTMTMVGSLNRGGALVALVKVDKLLYQVTPGSYLGQNFGRVTRITETEVVLREIVQDSAGEWTERPAALQLVEGNIK